jgi:hypothetical protein
MARKQLSEFRKHLQGTAYATLQIKEAREAVGRAVGSFLELDKGTATWEALCAIRDHVNALIGVHMDLEAAHRDSIMKRVQSEEFKGRPKDAIACLNSEATSTITDIYAEVDRQGIPE